MVSFIGTINVTAWLYSDVNVPPCSTQPSDHFLYHDVPEVYDAKITPTPETKEISFAPKLPLLLS
nr:MAG TPA: hypothetical protein [Caudoviricetes sp.]